MCQDHENHGPGLPLVGIPDGIDRQAATFRHILTLSILTPASPGLA